ncbi:MAG TPA: hypothetical protein VKQ54_17785 [Caulobacteraceae bacterium]|jgi:hypothetical protein|uniref:hypothetical protein n=1 Tax=Phenylobacterium sp. TaxID=1871053 RepID=UPI002C99FF6C|nr:hypothetical protein [Phenylobacterium sp.]HLZ85418.1 hypothetical protein [Caulobacteraceae bacterium]HXA37538.1 hypothetical protein [Phenylobacterium sp.]
MTPSNERRREHDLNLIVGGNFTKDALGVLYDEVLARVKSDPGGYLDTFERLYVRRPADLRQLSRLYLPAFLQHVAGAEPQRVRALAGRLLSRVDTAVRTVEQVIEQIGAAENLPQETVFTAENLDFRRRELRELVGA